MQLFQMFYNILRISKKKKKILKKYHKILEIYSKNCIKITVQQKRENPLFFSFLFLMKKTKTKQYYKNIFDRIFSKYIRLRDSDQYWIITCPLCWQKVPIKRAQNMHFVHRNITKYRFDENNCFAGCYRCNVTLHGNYAVYTLFMINKFWKEFVEKILNDKSLFEVWIDRYQEKIEEYKHKIKELLKTKILE